MTSVHHDGVGSDEPRVASVLRLHAVLTVLPGPRVVTLLPPAVLGERNIRGTIQTVVTYKRGRFLRTRSATLSAHETCLPVSQQRETLASVRGKRPTLLAEFVCHRSGRRLGNGRSRWINSNCWERAGGLTAIVWTYAHIHSGRTTVDSGPRIFFQENFVSSLRADGIRRKQNVFGRCFCGANSESESVWNNDFVWLVSVQ